jgi:hypothetical protein
MRGAAGPENLVSAEALVQLFLKLFVDINFRQDTETVFLEGGFCHLERLLERAIQLDIIGVFHVFVLLYQVGVFLSRFPDQGNRKAGKHCRVVNMAHSVYG